MALSNEARSLVLRLEREAHELGVCTCTFTDDETINFLLIDHAAEDIEAAANGDVNATIQLRQDFGLPVFR